MDLRSLLRSHRSNVALVIGNGVNRYGAVTRSTNSWNELLVKLAAKYLPRRLREVPQGISLTEFYDVLELTSTQRANDRTLQQEFCNLMKAWKPYAQHELIVEWAKENERPILTTNFDEAFSDAGFCSLYRLKNGGFTDYYPWESYYGAKGLADPTKGFGIWHVNGMQRYHRSVRLGLTHYMGSVERARGWLHKGNERRLFSGKNIRKWEGARSWLHIVFNCPLVLFGLGLEEDEVFLRWLLIERARYFRKFSDRRQSAWYIYAGTKNNAGKQYFLEGVGITPVQVESYDAIYGTATWK